MALFALAYLSHLLWFWPLEGLDIIILLCPPPLYLKGCQFCPTFFLGRESWSQLYQMFFYCPLAWSCPQIFNSGLWMRLYEGGFGFWQGVVFMQNFWNFKTIPDTEIILTSIQSRLILKKFKWFLWRGFQMWWKLFVLIFGEKYEVTFGWSQKVEISILGLLRTVFRRKCEKHKVTSGGSQKVEISIWGLLRTVFQSIHFICMNNDFVSHEKALPTDPDCLPLIRKGLIRHVM